MKSTLKAIVQEFIPDGFKKGCPDALLKACSRECECVFMLIVRSIFMLHLVGQLVNLEKESIPENVFRDCDAVNGKRLDTWICRNRGNMHNCLYDASSN